VLVSRFSRVSYIKEPSEGVPSIVSRPIPNQRPRLDRTSPETVSSDSHPIDDQWTAATHTIIQPEPLISRWSPFKAQRGMHRI
jgi:hypothetical protein